MTARLDLRHTLRGLARDRAVLTVVLTDGTSVAGTTDQVGSDVVEISEHPPGEPRRWGCMLVVRTVPLVALAVVRITRARRSRPNARRTHRAGGCDYAGT